MGRLVIVPGETVLAEADRLLATPPGPAGTIGIEVQELTTACRGRSPALRWGGRQLG